MIKNRTIETDILSDVIETEQEIQTILERERKKSLEWIERVRAEVEREIAGEEERLKESAAKTLADAEADAEAKATELVNNAALQARRLAHIDDEVLRKIVARYIPRILPEE